MNPSSGIELNQPFLASEVFGGMFVLFGLVYPLIWWRDREPGIGWFAIGWARVAFQTSREGP